MRQSEKYAIIHVVLHSIHLFAAIYAAMYGFCNGIIPARIIGVIGVIISAVELLICSTVVLIKGPKEFVDGVREGIETISKTDAAKQTDERA